MSNLIPIINVDNNKVKIEDPNISTLIIDDSKKIIPAINTEKQKLFLEEKKATIIINNKSENLTPIIDETEHLVLEMNGEGPRGLTGPAGNGIEKIEKTSTSGLVDTYTIYFTNGSTFSYDIINGEVHYYDGPYEVIPMPYTAQILPTTNLVMSEDVNIQEIPYYEVTNPSGGYTATIGDIN